MDDVSGHIGHTLVMGVLVPGEFPMSSLKNDAERLVVQRLCDRLTDSWLVIPAVGLSDDDRDREIDVVVAHERDGIAVIEVKGHRPTIRNGQWYSGQSLMDPQPHAQAHGNAYALRERIRALHPTLSKVRVEYAVAFPNIAGIDGHLPPEVDRTQVLTFPDLEECLDAVERLMTRRFGQHPLGEFGIQKVVDLLRPNCEFRFEFEARARLARLRLEVICDQQVSALQTLDMNRRVCVSGAAGTGKTRLASAWARRALLRGERVLLTCFNIPLAEALRQRLGESDQLRIGAFHEVALDLDGMPPLEIPDDVDRQWWDTVEIGHLLEHWHEVVERFDTIIVDEAQDFSPTWLELLTRLLDADGARRLLLLADESQRVYERGFELPSSDDGWVRCELEANCRNTFDIARLLQQWFNGATAPVGGPESEDVRFIEASTVDEMVDAVGNALDDIEDRDHAADSVLVATFTRSVRDRLREVYGFVAWEDLDPMALLCENVHRVKGLEYDHVILVVHGPDVRDELLYVGASRAVMSLTIIGPAEVGRRFSLADSHNEGA
jgi:hypothetical protein